MADSPLCNPVDSYKIMDSGASVWAVWRNGQEAVRAIAALRGIVGRESHANTVAQPRITPVRQFPIAPNCPLDATPTVFPYQFFTKGYYPEATKIVEKLGPWFWAIQIGRGVLMTLAVVPIIYTLRMRRWQTAIAVGTVIWVAGGLAPLLPPNPYMGATQRFIHIVEIFTQNFSLGVTAALLLRRKESQASHTPFQA